MKKSKIKPASDKPTPEEQTRVFDLRCQAKKGYRLHPDDQMFLETMCFTYLEWYSSTEDAVREATKPYGAI